jgi:hypothetical protein
MKPRNLCLPSVYPAGAGYTELLTLVAEADWQSFSVREEHQHVTSSRSRYECRTPSAQGRVQDSAVAGTSSGFRQCRYKFKIPWHKKLIRCQVMPTMWRLQRPTETFKSDLRRLMCGAIGCGDEAKHRDNRTTSDAAKIESRNYFYQGNPSLGVQQRYELVNKFMKE